MEMNKLDCAAIHIGSCFSEPVYFDDGKNMFLPAGKLAKPYHVSALVHWKIPYLLTAGQPIDPKDFKAQGFSDVEKKVENQKALDDDVEELESL